MKKKPKYDWRQPSLFPEYDLHPASKELREMRTGIDKNGKPYRNAVIVNTKAEFVEQARKIWGDKYDYTDSVYFLSKTPITIYCPKHDCHFRVAMAQNHIIKPQGKGKATGCPICSYEQQYGKQYGPEWREILRLSPKQNRVGKIYQAKFKTPEQRAAEKAEREAKAAARKERKAQRWQAYQDRLQRQKEETRLRHETKKASRAQARADAERQRIKDLQERILREAPLKQGDGYLYRNMEKAVNGDSHVLVHCPNPGHEWHPMLVRLILQGCKCRECAGRHQPLEERRENFLKKFYKKHGKSHYRLTADDYLNNDTPIKVHCLVHHYDFKTKPDNLLRGGGGCPYCTASEGEATILGWLDNHNIPYIWHEQIPNEDQTLPLQYVETDFWLPDYNLYIEYHGQQHYEETPHFYEGKKVRTFAVQQHRDRYLRQYCCDRKIRLIEIPYTDFDRIGEILSSILLEGKTDYSTYYVNDRQ